MKKRILAVLMATVMVVSMAACQTAPAPAEEKPVAEEPAAEEPATEEPATEEPAAEATGEIPEIVLSRWAGPHADDQKKVVAQYEDAEIIIDDIDYGNLQQKQIQSMSTSADYDLVWFQEIWLNEYVTQDFLLPLNDLVQKEGADLSIYLPSMIEGNTVDGQFYGFPTMAQTYILTYNKEWFDKEGQKVPETPEELVAVAKYFKEQGTGIAIPALQGMAAADVFASLLFSFGGDYFTEDGQLNLTSEEAVKAMQLWKDLCDNSMTGSLTWHNDQVSQAIREEQAPFGITITGLGSLDADPEQSLIVDKVAYAPIPGEKGSIGVVSYWSWGVAANSKNTDAAFNVAKWLTSPEIEKEQAMMNGQITAVASLAEDAEVVANIPFLGAANAMLENAKTQPSTGNASQIFEPLCATLSEVGSTGVDPTEALEKLQASLADVSNK